MARLAWFSPMPPARSGVAVYSADIVERLRDAHEVQVFVDEPVARAARAAGVPRTQVRSAHDFVWLQQLNPYDLPIYQVGNSSAHDYLWPYLLRYPGLAVLHDGNLHHARAAALLRERRPGDYRSEFVASHPDVPADLAELAIRGFDSHLYYEWPMTRLIIERSRVSAVHSAPAATALQDQYPQATIERIRLGHGTPLEDEARRAARRRICAAHGLTGDAVLFGVFGGLTPEKRIREVLDAFTYLQPYAPSSRLLLVGAAAAHYDVAEDVRARGLEPAVTITGYVDDDGFTDYLGACDVSINLRWPTAREISGPWVRALAAGCATITTDLWHTANVPGLDPRTWTVNHLSPTLDIPAPVTVKVDILDEVHSLGVAMRRLASDPALRSSLAAAGRAWWTAEHSLERMREDYERAIVCALARPGVAPPATADAWLRELVEPFGITPDLWS